jgi:hypothetical protein
MAFFIHSRKPTLEAAWRAVVGKGVKQLIRPLSAQKQSPVFGVYETLCLGFPDKTKERIIITAHV